ncbi:hypothetical protein AGMMS50218_08410 [Actinomycetota bacterium]|nr:hypothetical protein AGMMS50218_08410 [Actinomycetota bacterium]
MRWYSSGLSPSSANGWARSGVAAAWSTVSETEVFSSALVIGSLSWWAGRDGPWPWRPSADEGEFTGAGAPATPC